ncbi:4170_t:CDS:10 [Diversispora eburnea]|uniref:mRNA guanylyltransferase n=1 Tax=Diversispora eburnea TaxID=1213867 RepID=A0A9N8YM35_9GLOM|nr:4170_t:CDS:10 [Diversispora eburnea]
MNTPRKQIKLESEESPQVALPAIPGKIVDKEQTKLLKEKISELLFGKDSDAKPSKKNLNFPAQPISFTKCHIKELLQESYYVCEKSDGIRVLVYLTENDGRQEVYLIDRKNKYRYIEGLVFPDPKDQSKPHKGTLFDVVRLYAFDCLLDREENLMQKPLNKRLEIVIRVNKELDFSRKNNNRFKHKSDGLIFTSLPAPYSPDENSIDFKLKCYYSSIRLFPEQRPDKFELHVNKGKKYYEYYDELQVPDNLWEKWLKQEMITNQETSERNLNLDGRIVEVCRKEYPDGSKKWEFMRFRDDKRDGNYYTVVDSILQSIDDNLTEEELRSAKDEIKNAWVQRPEVV